MTNDEIKLLIEDSNLTQIDWNLVNSSLKHKNIRLNIVCMRNVVAALKQIENSLVYIESVKTIDASKKCEIKLRLERDKNKLISRLECEPYIPLQKIKL